MADITEYLEGLSYDFSEKEKELMDIFAECWEHCYASSCTDCEFTQGNRKVKLLICMSYQYAKRLISADVALVRHGKWQEITTHNGCTCDYDCVCSICGESGVPSYDFCPHCGAKMDG